MKMGAAKAMVGAAMAVLMGDSGGASRPIRTPKTTGTFGSVFGSGGFGRGGFGRGSYITKKRNGGTPSGAAAMKRAAKKRNNIRKKCKK